jgi:hypothetical protein
MSSIPLLASFTAIPTRPASTDREAAAAPDPEARRLAYVLSRAETAECTCPASASVTTATSSPL